MKVKKLKGLNFFEDLLEQPQNQLVDRAIEQGRIPIGYNCYLVPEALFSAGNVFPIWMRAPGVITTPQADYYLSSVICSYAKAILENGLDGKYDFLGGLVFAASCDHIRRAGQHFKLLGLNNENEKFFTYMLDTPHKVSESGVRWLITDLKKVVKKLNENYNANINEDTLKEAIKEINEFNILMQSIGDMRKGDNPKITGTEFHKVYGASKVAPKDMLIKPLEKLKAELKSRESVADNDIRLMVVGPTFDNPEFVQLIENQGAIVVADRYCFGSLPGMELIEEVGDPYENIAKYYLETCQCSRMMEKGKDRIEYCKNLAEEYDVDGIVFQTIKFCDLWGYESLSFIDGMKNNNIPVVTINREYAMTGEGQLRTRIQAFIESIKNKKDLCSVSK